MFLFGLFFQKGETMMFKAIGYPRPLLVMELKIPVANDD